MNNVDWMTSRGPFQPQLVCDSVKLDFNTEHHVGNDLTWDGGLVFLLSCLL